MAAFRFLALGVLIMPAGAISQAPVKMVELSSFAFAPRTITLAAGKPVSLTFVNRSRDAHDFTAKRFFASAKVIGGSAVNGEIELKGGQSRTITLVPVAGRYSVHCGHFMHKQFGMRGEIVVR